MAQRRRFRISEGASAVQAQFESTSASIDDMFESLKGIKAAKDKQKKDDRDFQLKKSVLILDAQKLGLNVDIDDQGNIINKLSASNLPRVKARQLPGGGFETEETGTVRPGQKRLPVDTETEFALEALKQVRGQKARSDVQRLSKQIPKNIMAEVRKLLPFIQSGDLSRQEALETIISDPELPKSSQFLAEIRRLLGVSSKESISAEDLFDLINR